MGKASSLTSTGQTGISVQSQKLSQEEQDVRSSRPIVAVWGSVCVRLSSAPEDTSPVVLARSRAQGGKAVLEASCRGGAHPGPH